MSESGEIESVPLRALRRAQELAWSSGHARIPMATLRRRREAAGNRQFSNTPAPGAGLAVSGQDTSTLGAEERAVPGGCWLQDSPGLARSSARRHRRDPRLVGAQVRRVVASQEWGRMIALAQVADQWEQIVGADVAAHARVEHLESGRLIVRTTSTAWAANLRILLPQLMRRIDEAVGAGAVETVIVKGPDQPSWTHGPRRVRGRGVRDTYA